MLGLDFDGTVAPIVDDPRQARADPGILDLLSDLIRTLRAIAVISGRDADDLATRVPIAGLLLSGNHGMELRNGEADALAEDAKPYLPRLRDAAEVIAGLPAAAVPGVAIERKRASLSVHYRNAVDPGTVRLTLRAALEPVAAKAGLRLDAGRMVWELRPPITVDKGQVLQRLRRALDPAGILYVGDDLTDAAAFVALHAMRGVSTLSVGVYSREAPKETFDACDVIVDGLPGVRHLLGALRNQVRGRGPAAGA